MRKMSKLSTGEVIKLISLYRYLLKNGRMTQDLYDTLVGNATIKHVIGY